jgi:hypothetical protein
MNLYQVDGIMRVDTVLLPFSDLLCCRTAVYFLPAGTLVFW